MCPSPGFVYLFVYPVTRTPGLPFGVTGTPVPGNDHRFSVSVRYTAGMGRVLTERDSVRPVLLVWICASFSSERLPRSGWSIFSATTVC